MKNKVSRIDVRFSKKKFISLLIILLVFVTLCSGILSYNQGKSTADKEWSASILNGLEYCISLGDDVVMVLSEFNITNRQVTFICVAESQVVEDMNLVESPF